MDGRLLLTSVSLAESVFIGIGMLLWLGTVFGFYNYVQLSRISIKRPSEVSEEETVGMWVTVHEDTDLVRTPFSSKEVALVYWEISDIDSVPDDTGPISVANGIRHGGSLIVESEGYRFPVELPSEMSSMHIQDTTELEGVETVEPTGTPPPHIEEFERRHNVDEPNHVGKDIEKRSYNEAAFNVGDEVLVYGKAEPRGGNLASDSQFKITPSGPKFRIMREGRERTRKKRLVASAVTFVLGCVFVGVGVFLL